MGYTNSNNTNIYIPKPSYFVKVKDVKIYSFEKYIILVPICSISIKKRNLIRYTWGKIANKLKYKVIFYMGGSDIIEDMQYNDIVQFSFKDSYFNLTISTLLIYNWTKTIYKNFDFILRIDSDVYPNIQLINLFILLKKDEKESIYGYYYPQMRTSRNKSNSNYIPFEIYPFSIIPEFVAGNFYILPIFNRWLEFVDRINISSNNLIYREDIQMGLYLKLYNIQIIKVNKYYKRKNKFVNCKDYQLSLAVHGITKRTMNFIYSNCV